MHPRVHRGESRLPHGHGPILCLRSTAEIIGSVVSVLWGPGMPLYPKKGKADHRGATGRREWEQELLSSIGGHSEMDKRCTRGLTRSAPRAHAPSLRSQEGGADRIIQRGELMKPPGLGPSAAAEMRQNSDCPGTQRHRRQRKGDCRHRMQINAHPSINPPGDQVRGG